MVQFIKSTVPARIDAIACYLSQSREPDADCATHQFCNDSALAIMEATGHREEVDRIRPFLAILNKGVVWADNGYRNITHFFSPLTGKGLWNLPSAADVFRQYIRQAIKYSQKANPVQAMFYSGAAVHLLQDICVPHHSCNLLFNGHTEYEHWVQSRLNAYPLVPPTIHFESDENYMGMFLKNAQLSKDYLDLVSEKASELDYRNATGILLPLAQYSTAKMFLWLARNLAGLSQHSGGNTAAL